MSNITIDRLRGLDLFAGCGRRELRRIDELTVTLQIPAGRRLCVEGARGGELFVVVEGVANLQSSSGHAALLGAGAWFGEGALIDGAPRRATITTVSDAMVIVFGRREFRALWSNFPNVRARLEAQHELVVPHDPVLVGDAVLSR